mmetsp:Transcript_14420/g.25820  ORF Transcript_14420/g.25820 Transcript_14420/m.25820 type:complete len:96 (-) Transcript_14420:47-334(-)
MVLSSGFAVGWGKTSTVLLRVLPCLFLLALDLKWCYAFFTASTRCVYSQNQMVLFYAVGAGKIFRVLSTIKGWTHGMEWIYDNNHIDIVVVLLRK